jgi:hypothetical protein
VSAPAAVFASDDPSGTAAAAAPSVARRCGRLRAMGDIFIVVRPDLLMWSSSTTMCAPVFRARMRLTVAGEWEEVRFALDSPVEGDGFELPVPVRQAKLTRFCR